VENQLKLIEYLSNSESAGSPDPVKCLKSREEFFLYYFVKYAQEIKNHNLIFEVKRSVESIRMDAGRLLHNGIFSNNEFKEYINQSSKPLFNIVYYFLFPSEKTFDEKKSMGNFIGYIATYRDFFEDLDAGYVNIGKEDILKYNLNIADLRNDKKLFVWMADKYSELIELMYEEIAVLKSMHIKLKLFWLGPYLVVLKLLIRIEVYDYKFGTKIKKNLMKEVNVFFQSFLLSWKLLLRVFEIY